MSALSLMLGTAQPKAYSEPLQGLRIGTCEPISGIGHGDQYSNPLAPSLIVGTSLDKMMCCAQNLRLCELH